MKRGLATAIAFCVTALSIATATGLRVDLAPQFNGKPLVFDALTNRTAAGQLVSVTRLDFLLSDFSLRRPDGSWIGNKTFFAYISARSGKTHCTLNGIPRGKYDGIRFHVGLEPQINHGDIAQWPAGHPLNPDVNHLYWGWSHEYVFLAFEGHWSAALRAAVNANNANTANTARTQRLTDPRSGAKNEGFSYHLATDRLLMTVQLPVHLDLNRGRDLQLALNVDRFFSTPNSIRLSSTTDTSHSRTNDLLAARLQNNIADSFAVQRVKEFSPVAAFTRTNHVEIASHATPYRFTFAGYFPRPDLPPDNPLTVEGVELGGKLFFDRRLSANNSESCATCHDPRRAFSQPRRVSRGANGEPGTRNAMTLENLAWKDSFFWDGRAATLREQVLQPIENPVEMHESPTTLVAKISADRNYPRWFANAFGSPVVTTDRIARALEQFLLVQVSFDSKFDRVMEGRAKFTKPEARGFLLFNTEYDPYHGQYGADCFHCHGGPLFQSQDFANNGLDATFPDPGRYHVTKQEGDRGKFAVPSLRNIAVTGPYMHDGRFQTLAEVVGHYCTGMKRSATLDPNLAKHPDGGVPLNQADQQALVAFLNTLTDEKFLPPAIPTSLARE